MLESERRKIEGVKRYLWGRLFPAGSIHVLPNL